MKTKRILNLSLKKVPFEVMVTGEKQEEFRRASDWLYSRLFDSAGNEKEYDFIKFTNGYGNDKPYFVCEYGGFMACYMDLKERKYSNGLTISGLGKGSYILYCGDIVEKGNLNNVSVSLKGMCYSQFVAYLKTKKIEYMEEKNVCIEKWFEEYLTVTPLESRLKERYFARDGGSQLF